MAYLTLEEYEEFSLNDGVTEEEFNKLLPRASSLLDIQTHNFYVFNDLEDDKVDFRKSRFKQALVAQIDYFKESGATTHYELNKAPQAFSAGRTSVTNVSGRSIEVKSKSLVAEEVYLLLSGTGLLYRGVRS